jgi:uncharacterized protein
VQKPSTLFDRDDEWSRLSAFVETTSSEPRLAIVYGRRRQGKSLLLAAICTLTGGFYWEALDGEGEQNLSSLSAAWSAWAETGTPVRFASWEEAVQALMSAGDVAGRPVPVVIDEVPRVIARAPELPSLLQRALGPGRPQNVPIPLVLCGSAFGEMRRLIDGPAPLRGRAVLELLIQPFPARQSATFWGLNTNPLLAFTHHALVGGTPAYRSLADGDTPKDGNLDRWVVDRLLDPSSSLFRDGRIAVAEDLQLGDQQRYWGLLAAIADGARTWGALETALGQTRGSLTHALNVVIDAGWVTKRPDPLRANRATYSLDEPMVRFYRLVIEPNLQRLNARRATEVWRDARPVVAAQILAPHLEHLALDWLVRHATNETAGGAISLAGPTTLDKPAAAQLDIAAVEATSRGATRPILIGEVKATDQRVGASELDRLDKVASRLDLPTCKRMIVSKAGFTTELERMSAGRGDVELVDLVRLYSGD